MTAKQRVLVRTDQNGRCMAGNGPIEHAAHRRIVDVCASNIESDDATGEHIDDHMDPMAAEQYRLTPEQVDAPAAVLGLCE